MGQLGLTGTVHSMMESSHSPVLVSWLLPCGLTGPDRTQFGPGHAVAHPGPRATPVENVHPIGRDCNVFDVAEVAPGRHCPATHPLPHTEPAHEWLLPDLPALPAPEVLDTEPLATGAAGDDGLGAGPTGDGGLGAGASGAACASGSEFHHVESSAEENQNKHSAIAKAVARNLYTRRIMTSPLFAHLRTTHTDRRRSADRVKQHPIGLLPPPAAIELDEVGHFHSVCGHRTHEISSRLRRFQRRRLLNYAWWFSRAAGRRFTTIGLRAVRVR